MTLFAGIAAVAPGASIPPNLPDALARSLSRNPADRPTLLRQANVFFAQIALPFESVPHAVTDVAGNITLLAGDPLLPNGRETAVAMLHESLLQDSDNLLRQARGQYCAAHWHAAGRRIVLTADKLALRPIYYALQDGVAYFSTALRVLESLGVLSRRVNLRGVAEFAALGYSLGTRTPYDRVARIEAGV
ncbi:MAG: hypothetical protein NZM12_02530, partial [Steroidobacteraceae bacterium]|nr:hypothetical protein [Steroidobacteraceae bacterium]